MRVATFGMARPIPSRARGAPRQDSARVCAALAVALTVALAAQMTRSAAAAEADIGGFSFACETPDGRTLKPRAGDIDGAAYTDLPAQRQQCLGTIDRKIARCRENTEFASQAENSQFASCLAVFRDQARACVEHFSSERDKCGAGTPDPGGEAAPAPDRPTMAEAGPAQRYRIEPVERLEEAHEAANVRTGPGPDYDIIGTVNARDRLRVTGEVEGRDWLRVEFRDGGQAFVYGPLLRPVTATPGTAAGQPAGPDWSIVEDRPCQVWNYGQRDYEPFTWSGACVDGKASGEGRLVFRGGEGTYDGGMRAGKLHGRGVLQWANGFRYEGELRDGRQHGYGTFTEANGERYEGQWQDGRPHGQGAYVQSDGATFEGEWRNGCFGSRSGRWASIGTSASACGFVE